VRDGQIILRKKRYTVAVSTRRELLLSVAAALPAAAQHEHPDTSISVAYTTRVLSPDQMKRLATLVDQIIPRTDTPGASDAHVPEFIDRKLSLDPVLKERFLTGLKAFNGTLSDTDPFSKLLKDMTIDGYYTSKEGLVQELGWHGNTFVADFKGCTHPEHQS
jgi:hypothetical protein